MINIHSIQYQNNIEFSDMILAQIWEIRKRHDKIRINLKLGSTTETRGIKSSIEIWGFNGRQSWYNWLIEVERLDQWIRAGKPFVPTDDLEIIWND